jgi:hypothetical protein
MTIGDLYFDNSNNRSYKLGSKDVKLYLGEKLVYPLDVEDSMDLGN